LEIGTRKRPQPEEKLYYSGSVYQWVVIRSTISALSEQASARGLSYLSPSTTRTAQVPVAVVWSMSYCTFSITNSTPERKWINSKDLSNMDPKQKKTLTCWITALNFFPGLILSSSTFQ
jgi:hypothetical protein